MIDQVAVSFCMAFLSAHQRDSFLRTAPVVMTDGAGMSLSLALVCSVYLYTLIP